MFRNLAISLACLALPLFPGANAHAGNHEDQVRTCGVILRDLPEKLASSFCSSYAGITDVTSTCTTTSSASCSLTTANAL